MLRPYEDGSFGDSNGRIYAIAAHVGQASRPPLQIGEGEQITLFKPFPMFGEGWHSIDFFEGGKGRILWRPLSKMILMR